MNIKQREGESAFQQGARRSSNPYDVETNDWVEWMDGFDAAASQADHPHQVSARGEHVTVR